MLTAAGLDFGRTHSSFTARKGTLSGFEIALGDQKSSDDVPSRAFRVDLPGLVQILRVGSYIMREVSHRISSFIVSGVVFVPPYVC